MATLLFYKVDFKENYQSPKGILYNESKMINLPGRHNILIVQIKPQSLKHMKQKPIKLKWERGIYDYSWEFQYPSYPATDGTIRQKITRI